jgi:peptide/nickel transport system substrate-binding protein
MNARTRLGVVALSLLVVAALVTTGCAKKEVGPSKGQNIDTLVVAMGADARSLDPHATNDQPSAGS